LKAGALKCIGYVASPFVSTTRNLITDVLDVLFMERTWRNAFLKSPAYFQRELANRRPTSFDKATVLHTDPVVENLLTLPSIHGDMSEFDQSAL
jgi:hypothetical protein